MTVVHRGNASATSAAAVVRGGGPRSHRAICWATRGPALTLTSLTESCSTRVRIPHDSQLPTSRASMWRLLQGLPSTADDGQLTTVLATLESIYGVEYQALAEQLLSSYQASSRQASPGDSLYAGDASEVSSDLRATLQDTSYNQLFDHLSPSYTPVIGSWSDPGLPLPAEAPLGSPAAPEARAVQGTAEQSPGSAAFSSSELDQRFMALLLLLAQRAHYTPFTARDAQLGISLNTDYLWQLFIKASSKNLDRELVAPWEQQAEELPKEAQGVLMLRRGYGSESTQGRLLLQKLDYLQLLLIKRAAKGLSSVAVNSSQQLLQQLFRLWSALQGALPEPQDGTVEQEQEEQEEQEEVSPMSSSSQVYTQEQQQQQQQQEQQQQEEEEVSTLSSSNQAHIQEQQQGTQQQHVAHTTGQQQEHAGAAELESSPSPANSGASGTNSTTTSSSNRGPNSTKSSSSTTTTSSSNSSGAAAEAAPGPGQVAAEVVQANLQRTQQAAAAAASNAQSAAQAAATSTLKQLQQRLVDSGFQLAEAMSDWGLIPRLGVIPLEQFEQVYPIQEPARLRPLYIQKASLPDILDPLVSSKAAAVVANKQQQQQQQQQAHLSQDSAPAAKAAGSRRAPGEILPAASGPEPASTEVAAHAARESESSVVESDTSDSSTADSSSTTGSSSSHNPDSSNGSSSSSSTADSCSTSTEAPVDSSSDPGASSFWSVFPQRVQIVEPTLREVLVVYRRQPPRQVFQWPPKWFQRGPRRSRASSKAAAGSKAGTRNPKPSAASIPGTPPAAAAAEEQEEALDGEGVVSVSGAVPQPICVEVYRDIPLPSWQVVCPNKLLQFRPLDLLRVDLFALTGISAGLAQQVRGTDSLLLDLLPLLSLGVLTIRVLLGYIRMGDRYKSIVNELLRERTLASREGALEYLATAAALQQFKQTALAYTLMTQLSQADVVRLQERRSQVLTQRIDPGSSMPPVYQQQQTHQQQVEQAEGGAAASTDAVHAGGGGEAAGGAATPQDAAPMVWWTPEQLASTAEALLEQELGLQVVFDAEEALLELRRLGLLKEKCTTTAAATAATAAAEADAELPVSRSRSSSRAGWLLGAGDATGPGGMLLTVIDRLWSSTSTSSSSTNTYSNGVFEPSRVPSPTQLISNAAQAFARPWVPRAARNSMAHQQLQQQQLQGLDTTQETAAAADQQREQSGGATWQDPDAASSSSGTTNPARSGLQPQQVRVLYAVVGALDAQEVLQVHWASLLQRRVDSIVRGLGRSPTQRGVRHGPLASSGSRRAR